MSQQYADTFSGIYIVLEKLVTEALKEVGTPAGGQIISDAMPAFKNAAVSIAGTISIMEAYHKQKPTKDESDD